MTAADGSSAAGGYLTDLEVVPLDRPCWLIRGPVDPVPPDLADLEVAQALRGVSTGVTSRSVRQAGTAAPDPPD